MNRTIARTTIAILAFLLSLALGQNSAQAAERPTAHRLHLHHVAHMRHLHVLHVKHLWHLRHLSHRRGGVSASRASRSGSRWAHPLPGVPVSSCYGWRWGALHKGIDYDGNFGDRIRAVGAGTVKKVGWWANGYGISVLVYHGGTTYSHYAHMQRSAVRVGQHVYAGQTLGYVGSTGYSTGSHLHFEIWNGMWGQRDPRPWMRAHGLRPGC